MYLDSTRNVGKSGISRGVLAMPLLVALLLLFSSACNITSSKDRQGSGNIESESRSVSGFQAVDICCGFELTISLGSGESLTIEADDNLLPEIVSEVRNGTLEVKYEDSQANYRPSEPVKVAVTAIAVDQIDVSGGGQVESSGLLNVETLALDLSGGADAVLSSLQLDTLVVSISGGGEATVGGQVNLQDVDLSGGSKYEAAEMRSQRAVVEGSGGSQATVWVDEELSVNLSGSSQVSYYGDPRVDSADLSGGSEIEELGGR